MRAFRELASESYGKKRRDKIKAKARTFSMHLKRHLVKGDLARLWNTDWTCLKAAEIKKGEESSFGELTVEELSVATFHCHFILGTCH